MATRDALLLRLETLTFLLDEKLETHPFPWTIEYGWGHEVVDARDARVHLFDINKLNQARLLVAMARIRERERIRGLRFGNALEEALAGDDDSAVDAALNKPWHEWDDTKTPP